MYRQFAKAMLLRICKDFYEMEITTAVPVDDQFSNPKQIRWAASYPGGGKLLVVAQNTTPHTVGIRNSDLSFYSKFCSLNYPVSVDADSNYIYEAATTGNLRSVDINTFASVLINSAIASIRMIDASGDPDYVYVTSNNATDGHGIRMVTKSTMAVTGGGTPVQILATGTGDNQFTNPLGILYIATNADSGFLYVCEATRICKIAVVTTAGSESFTWTTSYAIAANDLAWDGTNFYVQSSTQTIKYDNVFTDATKVVVSCVGYSITYIPDQGDGYGATLAIVDSTNSHLERRKCSDLSAINSVGSAGDGSSSLEDTVITGTAGVWRCDDGDSLSVASAANISKNGFSGKFFASAGPHKMVYTANGGLSLITAIDENADAIQGEIKNLHKCVNLTSLKLQTNPALVLNLGRLSAKLQTLWAYACGAGIYGSIRHMTALSSVNLRENGASSAQVDQWIDDLWQNRDIMTPGAANFNGTNAAPGGIYQEATPPTTGKEKAYDLVENYGWGLAITL